MQILTVAGRVIQQIIRDKRTLVFLLVAPVFVLGLLYIIMDSSSDIPNIGAVHLDTPLQEAIDNEANVTIYDNKNLAYQAVKNGEMDAYLYMDRQNPHITINGSDVTRNSLVIQAVRSALKTMEISHSKQLQKELDQLQGELTSIQNSKNQQSVQKIIDFPDANLFMTEPKFDYIYRSGNKSLFNQIAPALMGFFIFLFVFFIAGISFLRERTTGTLERTLATPLKRSSIVFGYFLGFFLFVAIQTVVIQVMMVDILDVDRLGSYWLLLFMNLIIATVALSLGLLLSTFAKTEFQLLQFIPVAVVPQFFFSGVFDLTNAPTAITIIRDIMPLSYAADALSNIMIRGYYFSDIIIDFTVLIGFTILFILLNMVILKWQRAA